MYNPLAEVGQAKQPLPQARGWLLEICGAGRFLHVTFMILCWFAWLLAYCLLSCFVWPHAMAPTIASGQKKNKRLGLFVFVVSFGARPVSKCKVHDFVLVHVIACLLFFFYLFRLATRNGSSHCIGPKKKTGGSACLSSLFLCLFVCLFVWSLVCLCVLFFFPLFLFQFLCFLMIDVPINVKILTNILTKIVNFITLLCVPLKPTTFGVSFPEVIMIANVFTPRKHQILCFFYKTDKKNCGV